MIMVKMILWVKVIEIIRGFQSEGDRNCESMRFDLMRLLVSFSNDYQFII